MDHVPPSFGAFSIGVDRGRRSGRSLTARLGSGTLDERMRRRPNVAQDTVDGAGPRPGSASDADRMHGLDVVRKGASPPVRIRNEVRARL